jgi:hypothetical protein
MILVRRIGAVLLAIAAVVVYVAMAPREVTIAGTSSHSAELASISSAYRTNNGGSQYIYGQILATGIASKDTLALLVTQADEDAARQVATDLAIAKRGSDMRMPAELMIGVIALALLLFTSRVEQTSGMSPSVSSPAANVQTPTTDTWE